jgi:hypothetical protein
VSDSSTSTLEANQGGSSGHRVHDRLKIAMLERAGLAPDRIEEALKGERETGLTLDRVLPSRNILPEDKTLDFLAEYPRPTSRWPRPSQGVAGARATSSTRCRCSLRARTRSWHRSSRSERRRQPDHAGRDECVPLDVQPIDDLSRRSSAEEVEPVLVPTSAKSRNLINRAYRHKADGVDDALDDIEEEDIMGVASPDRGVRRPPRRGQQGAHHQASSTCCSSRRSSCAPRTSTCSPIQDRRAGAHARRRRAVRHRGDPEEGAGGDRQPRQGDGQDGHRRAAPAAGRPCERSASAMATSTCVSPPSR